jgi:hypothetical protein
MATKKKSTATQGASTKTTKAKSAAATKTKPAEDNSGYVGIGMPVTQTAMKNLKRNAKKL